MLVFIVCDCVQNRWENSFQQIVVCELRALCACVCVIQTTHANFRITSNERLYLKLRERNTHNTKNSTHKLVFDYNFHSDVSFGSDILTLVSDVWISTLDSHLIPFDVVSVGDRKMKINLIDASQVLQMGSFDDFPIKFLR